MYVDPKSTILDVPSIRVRDFLRQKRGYEFNVDEIKERLDLTMPKARQLLKELVRLGYAELSKHQYEPHTWYSITLSGSTFSLASAAKPLSRKTAERKLIEFLQRVNQVNSDDYYLFVVKKVVVFGSYLSEQDRINDVDVAVELVPRENDNERQRDLERARISEAMRAGRRFSNVAMEVYWPYTEVILFLKSRSRAISLHTTADSILERANSRIVFEIGAGTA